MNFDAIPVENLPTLSRPEYELAVLYDELMDRYAKTPGDWAVAMTSVRLMAKRYGTGQMLQVLKLCGAPWVAERCRRQMTESQEFVVHLIVKFPPDDPGDVEKVAEELASSLAVFDSVQASMRLLKFLDRLLQRERTLQHGAARVYH